MDYSSIAHDPSDPVESSPWGSPRADRDTFGGSVHGADIVPAPLPRHQSPYDDNHDSEHNAGNAQAAASEQHDPLTPPRSIPSNEHGYAQQQQAAPQPQKRTEPPARYQTGARQNARQAAPTYRLQGKITALERTGKKDPILRFDVYVRLHQDIFDAEFKLMVADQYPQIPHHAISRHSSHPLRICQAL